MLQWWQSTNETFGHTLMEKEKYILIKKNIINNVSLSVNYICDETEVANFFS